MAIQEINILPKDAHSSCCGEHAASDASPKIIETWKEKGYTHVLLNRFGADFIRDDDTNKNNNQQTWDGLNTALNSLCVVKKIAGSYEIYALP